MLEAELKAKKMMAWSVIIVLIVFGLVVGLISMKTASAVSQERCQVWAQCK